MEMDFELSDEQKEFRESVAGFAAEEIAPVAEELDEKDQFPDGIIRKAAERGLLGITSPREYGGLGKDMVSFVLAIEELSKASPAVALTVSVNNSLICKPIELFGTEEQKRDFLPQLAKGKMLGAFALTEPGAGSDAGSIRTVATREGNEFVINGEKMFITNAGKCGLYLLFAKTSPELGARGITAFLLDADTPGLRVGRPIETMGMRGSVQAPVIMSGVRIPEDRIIGNEGKGFKIALTALNYGRLGVTAQAVGIAQAAFEESVKFSSNRVQFGKAISEFSPVKNMLADMATEIAAARALMFRAATLMDRGKATPADISMAKLYASTAANEVVSSSVYLHGGRGYVKGSKVERLYRDAKITEIYEGTSEVQRMIISRELLGSGK